MGVQPSTLLNGLASASRSNDAIPPISAVNSPATGSILEEGSVHTITGTAMDKAGGAVGAVEVSVDGGATWRRAEGRENWSYQWRAGATGPVTIMARAVDDSANLEIPGPGVVVSVTTTAPTVIQVKPGGGESGVNPATSIAATFSEAIDPATIHSNTFQLLGPSGALIASEITYDGTARTATLKPGLSLALGTTYTATIKSGASGVKDLAGNALECEFVWSFTTDRPPVVYPPPVVDPPPPRQYTVMIPYVRRE
jgi:hypothetical protein